MTYKWENPSDWLMRAAKEGRVTASQVAKLLRDISDDQCNGREYHPRVEDYIESQFEGLMAIDGFYAETEEGTVADKRPLEDDYELFATGHA
jgi:hypothetical protein